jgi:hypothetical protein
MVPWSVMSSLLVQVVLDVGVRVHNRIWSVNRFRPI